MKSRAPWLLDPTVTFLNHGSFGGCPEPVLEEQSRLRAELERRPIEWLAPERTLEPKLDHARQALARVVGAPAKDLVFVGNATSAVNAVLRSARFDVGDEIVITDHGYNACNNVVRYLAERSGIVPVVAKLPFPVATADELVDAIVGALSERTKLLLVDHITSPTALVLPIERITARCHERGVRVLVDGAHAPGMVPLDIESIGADYYTGNCHKWLCTPKGCAFLYVREGLQEEVRPTSISHGHNTPRPGRTRYQTEFDWPGTYDPTPYLTLPFAIDWLSSQDPAGLTGVMERNRQQVLTGRDILARGLGLELPAPAELIGAIASLPLPIEPGPTTGLDPLHVRLYETHKIEVPVHHWPARGRRWIRISAQLHNDDGDYLELVRALRAEGLG